MNGSCKTTSGASTLQACFDIILTLHCISFIQNQLILEL